MKQKDKSPAKTMFQAVLVKNPKLIKKSIKADKNKESK